MLSAMAERLGPLLERVVDVFPASQGRVPLVLSRVNALIKAAIGRGR
jgi:hypothetical protein